jgi:outer membrane protein assembly factor BamB
MASWFRYSLAVVLLGSALVRAESTAGVYSGFRGDGTGKTQARDLPLEWSPTTVAWKADLPGYGQSSPVVLGNTIFLTAIEGPNKEKNLVIALDAATGKRRWLRELPASQTMKASFSVSRAAPTPVVDANGLTVFFESGELARFSLDGEQQWLRSLVKEYGEFKNGHMLGSSLAQTADSVFVLVDHQAPSYLLSVDKKTGKNRWKADRKGRVSWTTPVVVNQGKSQRLVISSGGSVDVYDCETGQQLSSYTEVGNNSVPSAVVQGNRVVIGASDPPRNPDRALTLKSCCCLELQDDGRLGKKLWSSERATASFASPLIAGDCVYYINTVGVLYCLDLNTGKEHYAMRTGASCWASPVLAGDRIYLFGKNGITTVVRAGPKFEKLATNLLWEGIREESPPKKPEPADKVDLIKIKESRQTPPEFLDPIVYGVAMVDGAFFIRTGTALYAVKQR